MRVTYNSDSPEISHHEELRISELETTREKRREGADEIKKAKRKEKRIRSRER